jgi:hypothetical protein
MPRSWHSENVVFFDLFSSPLHKNLFFSSSICFLPSLQMKTESNCKACTKPFVPRENNRKHQRFCSEPSCQQARRSYNQRCRRKEMEGKRTQSKQPQAAVYKSFGVEAGLKPAEAALARFHPVIIGMVSQMIGSIYPEDILATIRRLWQRGNDIVDAPSLKSIEKPGLKGIKRSKAA